MISLPLTDGCDVLSDELTARCSVTRGCGREEEGGARVNVFLLRASEAIKSPSYLPCSQVQLAAAALSSSIRLNRDRL